MKLTALAAILQLLVRTFDEIIPDERGTEFQEDFAGKHALSRAMFDHGFVCICRDLCDSQDLDILRGLGFLSLLAGLRHLCKGGLSWWAPPCSSWVWLSRGSTHSSALNPRGSSKYQKVGEANRICRRMIYLLEYIIKKEAYFAIEQPCSSVMWRYRPMRKFLKKSGAIEISIPLGHYGATSVILVLNNIVVCSGDCPCSLFTVSFELDLLAGLFVDAKDIARKRVTIMTNAPFLATLGVKMDRENLGSMVF